jgi:hypothetical protein
MSQEPTLKQMAKRTGINLAAHAAMQAILWSLPFLLSAMTVVAGYFQSVPWMYVIVAATFVFASAAAGALRLSEFWARITAQNKLALWQILPAANFIRDKRTGKIKSIEKMQVCIILQNNANFPISYIVDELSTSFEGMMNARPIRDTMGADISPTSQGWYRDAPIDVKQMPVTKQIFEGHIKFKLRYGLPGNEKHPMERNLNLTFVFDDKAGGFSQVSTTDVIENVVRDR